MPPKTQPFALALQKRDSLDKCMEHLDEPSWSKTLDCLRRVMVDFVTCIVNSVKAFAAIWCFSCILIRWSKLKAERASSKDSSVLRFEQYCMRS